MRARVCVRVYARARAYVCVCVCVCERGGCVHVHERVCVRRLGNRQNVAACETDTKYMSTRGSFKAATFASISHCKETDYGQRNNISGRYSSRNQSEIRYFPSELGTESVVPRGYRPQPAHLPRTLKK